MIRSTFPRLRFVAAALAASSFTVFSLAAASLAGEPDVIVSGAHHEPGQNRLWREGMVSGNGRQGVVTSGAPFDDTLIFQNMIFTLPTKSPRETPAVIASELVPSREHIFRNDASWKFNGRRRDFDYPFHPAHQLRLTLPKQETTAYRRWTNLATAEVGVAYTDRNGDWERRTFASRADDVVITALHGSSLGAKIDLTLSIDDLSSMYKFGKGTERDLRYKKVIGEDGAYIALIAHYPAFEPSELKEAGYAGLTQIVAVGGRREVIQLPSTPEPQNVGESAHPAIKITGADAVYLITKSDRSTALGPLSSFASSSRYELLERLHRDTAAVAKKYAAPARGFDYAQALAPHAELHGELFARVKLNLGVAPEDRALTNEQLIARQKTGHASLDLALLERVYAVGRYVELCASGTAAPRLCGLWTGEWNPGWGGIYTMDANVNLQVSPMNTGDLTPAALGYIDFVLRQVEDWRKNATDVYGMHDAIQVPVNTDGDRAPMIESDAAYPFQYWNAGASWMLLPIYEYWQCHGNQRITLGDRVNLLRIRQALGVRDGGLSELEAQALATRGWLDLERDILLPLLTKQANFWEQLCNPEYYTDAQGRRQHQPGKTALEPGEKYLLIPTYSPENKPQGYDSTLTVNATMDIAAARDGLAMVIALEKTVNRPQTAAAIARWTRLLELLPDYQYDGTPGEITATGGGGALREWATQDYLENNNHRHSSHLYVAWPGYETRDDPRLFAGSKQAVANRDRLNRNDNTTGHGWIHRALISARLGDGKDVATSLLRLIASDIYYSSLLTDHNTNRKSDTYCTDTSIGLVGVINESLVFSNTGVIEFLPAPPTSLPSGSITGLMARTRAEIEELTWEPNLVTARIRSDIDQELVLKCGLSWSAAKILGAQPAKILAGQQVEVSLKAGETLTIAFCP